MILDRANYIVDNKGKIQYAVIPYDQWTNIQKKIKKLETIDGIYRGLAEAKGAKRKNNLSTLREFLSESWGSCYKWI